MSTVTVTADATGNVIGVSQNNPEYGYIRVEQIATQINDEGWLKTVRRSALIKGRVEDLISTKYAENSEIPGKIVVRESLTPFNAENPDRDLKIAGSTGIICRVGDEPIYRQTFFTSNLNALDEFIMHDNKEEIKDVQTAQTAMSSLTNRRIKKTSETAEL
jgi:hypothetical protein